MHRMLCMWQNAWNIIHKIIYIEYYAIQKLIYIAKNASYKILYIEYNLRRSNSYRCILAILVYLYSALMRREELGSCVGIWILYCVLVWFKVGLSSCRGILVLSCDYVEGGIKFWCGYFGYMLFYSRDFVQIWLIQFLAGRWSGLYVVLCVLLSTGCSISKYEQNLFVCLGGGLGTNC